jgi:competence protein ComEA
VSQSAQRNIFSVQSTFADSSTNSGPSVGATAAAQTAQAPQNEAVFPIDINRATYAQLNLVPGIGPAKASAILEYRDFLGVFVSLDQLLNIRGFGEKTVEKLSVYFTLEAQ